MKTYDPVVVCFSCKFGWGYLSDDIPLKNWMPVICTGKIDATQIMEAFKAGADGVLILGCPEGDCHYQDGNHEARKRVHLLRTLLEAHGIEKERLRLELSADPEGKSIPDRIEKMRKDLARLGRLKRPSTPVKAAEIPAMVRG